jgi:hypothetical protein
MTPKSVIVCIVIAILVMVSMATPVSAALVGDATSSVAIQTNGLLATATAIQAYSYGDLQNNYVGYVEKTVGTFGTSVYMRDISAELLNSPGEISKVNVAREYGFNVDGSGSGTASSYESGTVVMSGMAGNESQVVCDDTTVYSNLFAADSLVFVSGMNLVGGVIPAAVGSPPVSVTYNLEAMAVNAGISSIGAKEMSIGGIGNTTQIGATTAYSEKLTFNRDFAVDYSFEKVITYRPPPQEFTPPRGMCVFEK